jgi:methionyl-tRNA formyltransferase
MRMIPALDAGPIILTAAVPILDDETYGELQMRLSELGALTLVEALTLISVGEATETPQDASLATYAPKVTREDARVDWNLSAEEISRIIRAYDPKPGAFTTLGGVDVKLYGARPAHDVKPASEPGRVVDVRQGLFVTCGDGVLSVRDVKPAGKGRMTGGEWSRGRGITTGDVLGA